MRDHLTPAVLPTAGVTFGFPTQTSLCDYPATGTPTMTNLCQPHSGMVGMTPGPRRFGGSARLLVLKGVSSGIKADFAGGYTRQFFVFPYTAAQLGPRLTANGGLGLYSQLGYNNVTTAGGGYAAGATQQRLVMALHGTYTTGKATATVKLRTIYSYHSRSGSFDVNGTNLTGMMSLVRPYLVNCFLTSSQGGPVVSADCLDAVGANINFVDVEFLPEPGPMALLGAALLGVGLLQRRRG